MMQVKRVLASMVAVLGLLLIASPAQATLIFYASRAAFDLANPGLPIEGFENVTSGTFQFTGPLDATTSIGGIVDPGDILPGIQFVDNPGPGGSQMFFAGPGQSAQPTQALGQNFPNSDALDILFSPSVFSVAFDIFQNAGGGSQTGLPQLFPVSIFGSGGLLGATVITVASGGPGGFFGVTSDSDAIVRISVNNPALFDVIDDVAFGQSAPIPEPSALWLLGSALCALGAMRRRVR